MPVYKYNGINAAGKKVTDIIDADSPKGARLKLRKMDIFVTDLAETVAGMKSSSRRKLSWSFGGGIAAMDLSVMTRQMSTLVGASLPLVKVLSALTEQVENERLRSVLAEVREMVNEGSSLADALQKYPRIFSELYVNMIRAGEQSGALEIVLQRLADFTEGQTDLRTKLLYAMMYPMVIMVVGIGVVTFMFTFVIPRLVRLFEQTKQTLPALTQFMISVSNAFTGYWWAMLVTVVALVIGVRYYLRTPAGRDLYDRASLKVPVLGRIIKNISISRFAKTMSTLLLGGLPLLRGLEIVENVVNNTVLARAINKARENITEGANIADPLRASGIFPPFIIQMIASGEQSGDLEFMLEKASESFDKEVDAAITGLTAIIEPVMIILMAIMVAIFILSFILPILNITQNLR